MQCWVCKKLRADRGGACYLCRYAALKDSDAPRLDLRRLAGVLVGLLSIAAGLLTPAVVSPPTLPWRHLSTLSRPTFESPSDTPVSYVTTMAVKEIKRKVYPYSIVPGGAENVLQARHAMTDPAVKAHYADFDLSQLKQVKLGASLSGYVSYRWGDKIYWTAKKITLHAGETVFTDGTHVARGRCLNCYSALPMQPTRPREPTEIALDAPVEMPVTVYSFPKLPLLAPALPVPPGELTPSVPILPAGVGSTAGGNAPGGGFWFPLIPIIPPIHRHPGGGPSPYVPPGSPGSPGTPTSPGGPTPPVIIPPVAVVPEPRYGWVLLAGLFALGLTIRAMRARRPN